MNNRNGMLTSLLSLGAAGAAVFGIVRGMRSGMFQPFLQIIRSFMNGSGAQQIPQAAQGLMAAQNMTPPLQGMMNTQGSGQQSSNQKSGNTKQSITNLSSNKSN